MPGRIEVVWVHAELLDQFVDFLDGMNDTEIPSRDIIFADIVIVVYEFLVNFDC